MVMMKWHPDRNAAIPIHNQIKEYLRDKIVSGEWPVGTKIPSQRTLADFLGVNRSTVINPISELIADGLLEGNSGGGTKVINNTWNLLATEEQPDWSMYVSSGVQQPNPDMIRVINQVEFNPDIIRMGSCELSPENIPSATIRNLLKDIPQGIDLGYMEPKGLYMLRNEICCYLKTIGIEAQPANILIVSGALQGLQLITLGLLHRGSVVFLEKPSYLSSLRLFRSSGMLLSRIDMDSEGIDVKSLIMRNNEKRGAMLFTIPTFQNPTGKVMSIERRKELVHECKKMRLPIVEDDVYRELWYSNEPPPPIKAYDQNGTVLYVGSMSKNYCPGLRIGWVVGDEQVIDRLADIKMQFDYGSSSLSQWLASQIFKGGHYYAHNEQLRANAKLRRDTTLFALEKYFSGISTWNIPDGGYYIWLRLNNPVSMNALFTRALNQNILINPGNIYEFHSSQHIRISFSYASLDDIVLGLERLAKIIINL